MPTIPAPKEQSVMPDGSLPYQSVNTSPATFGAGLAQGMDQASDAQYQMLQQNQQIKVETDNTNALNKYMKGAQDLENGNQDQGIIGYRTLMGQNARNWKTYASQSAVTCRRLRPGCSTSPPFASSAAPWIPWAPIAHSSSA